ncbi:MAG: DUF2961 domain-containing protein [Pirellulales bacterium]|nr:DUF2961 domain-containing protein [Pirellulales bacterium]
MKMYRHIVALSIVAGLIGVCPADADEEPVPGINELYRLDLLPRLRRFESVGCVSSRDPTGGNDDGFSGKHSFIRKEEVGQVIAELDGPGVITRFHMSQPTRGIIKFYFDGEASPRIQRNIHEMFTGAHPPFLRPMVGTEAGGRYFYVPLPFQQSCQIVIETETVHFFQINYAKYPKGTVIKTYQDPPTGDFLRSLDEARELFGSAGSDISARLVPEATPMETETRRETLRPGESVTLFETSNPGRIVGLKLTPVDAFAGKERDILLRMYWDGETSPAVSCPVGDFFGYSFGEPAVRSLLLGTAAGVNYAFFPMPFERSARIELVSERKSGPPFEAQAEITLSPVGKAADEGRFYAHWRRENPTRQGEPYTFLKTTGHGHVVGVIQQAQGLHAGHTGFFEGDDLAVIDGKPVAYGTGSEETFNGGWYDVPGRWEDRTSLPLSGCLEYKKYLGRTGGYRWMIADTYPYRESIDFTIEHGPEGNRILTDYTSVTFFYSLDPPGIESSVPAATDRRVVAPERIVFTPGWNVPIRTFSLQNATLAKQMAQIGDKQIRHLAFRATGRDAFGPHHVSFLCDMPADGRYQVGLKALYGPDQGVVQLYQHDSPIGEPVDLYSEEQRASDVLPLGVLDMVEGDNPVFLLLVGKDERSETFGLNAVELVFERVERNP